MALEPITRQEKIIAGQDLTPITRMEKFLKQFGGGGGSGLPQDGRFVVTFTFDDNGNIVSDKTFDEIFEAYKAGKKVSGLIVNGSNDWHNLHISTVNGDEIDFFMLACANTDVRYMVVRVERNGGNLVYFGSLTAGVS